MEKVWEWKLSGSKGASMCSLVHYLNSEDLLIFSLLLAFPVSHGVSQAIYPSSWICAGRQSLPLGLWKWWNDIEKEMINELSMDVLLLGDNICNTKVILSLGAANYICKPQQCGWGCLRHTISIAIATSNPFHPQHVFHSFRGHLNFAFDDELDCQPVSFAWFHPVRLPTPSQWTRFFGKFLLGYCSKLLSEGQLWRLQILI